MQTGRKCSLNRTILFHFCKKRENTGWKKSNIYSTISKRINRTRSEQQVCAAAGSGGSVWTKFQWSSWNSVSVSAGFSGGEFLRPLCSGRRLSADARLGVGGVGGAGGGAVLCEDGFELLQGGVGSDPRRVKVGPAHPEAGLWQVLEELVEPVSPDKPNSGQTFRKIYQEKTWNVTFSYYLVLFLCDCWSYLGFSF